MFLLFLEYMNESHDTYYRHIVQDKILPTYFSLPDLQTNNFLWLLSRIYHNLSKSRDCYIVLKDTGWHFSHQFVSIHKLYRDNSLLDELLWTKLDICVLLLSLDGQYIWWWTIIWLWHGVSDISIFEIYRF